MQFLKDYLPPVVTRNLQNLKNRKNVYSSFQETVNNCKTDGYASDRIADIVYEKTIFYRDNLNQNQIKTLSAREIFLIASIAKMNIQRIKVLDFGGALGAHYFFAKHFFPDITFEWVIIEMPTMVNKGLSLDEPNLYFKTFEQIKEEKQSDFDLVLTSATLQHLPEPIEGLKFLIDIQAPWLLFLRCGFALDSNQFWVIHRARYADNGPGTKVIEYGDEMVDFPFALISKTEFENVISQKYEEIMNINDNTSVLDVQGSETVGMNRFYGKKSKY